MFGLPNLQHEHYEMIKVLYSLFPDVHMYCVKDYIKKAASAVGSIPSHTAATIDTIAPTKFQFSPHMQFQSIHLNCQFLCLYPLRQALKYRYFRGLSMPQTSSSKNLSNSTNSTWAARCIISTF